MNSTIRWIFLFAICVLQLSCSRFAFPEAAPVATNGKIDLRNWDFYADGPVRLDGDYLFQWEQFTKVDGTRSTPNASSQQFAQVPRSWNFYSSELKPSGGHGFATFSLTVLLPEDQESLALRFLDMGTAYSFYVNRERLLTVGSPGKNSDQSRPSFYPTIVDNLPQSSTLEIVIHVSNFHHRRGGIWESIQLGLEPNLRNQREYKLFLDLLLFGVFMIISIYHIGLFAMRNKERVSLYFGFFCFFIAIRTLSVDERFIFQLIPGLGWANLVRLEYLSVIFAVPTFLLYFKHLFSIKNGDWFARVAVIFGLFIGTIVLVTPPAIYTYTSPPYQLFIVVCLVYAFVMLIRMMYQKRHGARIIFIGYLALMIASINDLLDVGEYIQSGHWLPFGLMVFVFSQSFMLAYRFSKAFQDAEESSAELKEMNENYRREIAERKKAEDEKRELASRLVRSQKMEALGLLAGGVAHDLNNVLSGIVSYPDLMLLDLEKESPLRQPLETIRSSGSKAAAIVEDLLTLARRGVMNMETVHLNEIVGEYLQSPEHKQILLTHPSIEIGISLEESLLNIEGSRIHLRNSIMNLILNAAESQPDGGSIYISTQNQYIDQPFSGYDTVAEGDYVLLSVADNGFGIDPDELQHIFEPFYTKKVMGRSGTGLGLAVVWGTMQDHQGYINVLSTPERGTSIELYFPVSQKTRVEAPASVPIGQISGHGERILVVDDVYEQREIAVNILTRLGYDAIAVDSGEEALSFFSRESVDLVILDMIMDPGMDGLDTFEALKAHDTSLKAIIASGYAETERAKEAIRQGTGSYIRKPYTIEKIGSAVRQELDK